MGWPGPAVTLLLLGITFLSLQSISDAAAITSRLPTHVLMTAIIVVNQEPLNLDHLSLSWDHNGRLLVEYKDNIVTSYDSRALMPQEQFVDGNVSLILTNITMNDDGNYTCRIEYGKQQERVQYTLRVEKHRIQLFNLSPKKVDGNIDRNAQESKRPSVGSFLQIGGNSKVIAKPGENISLMCKFNTDPFMELTMLSIRWAKDGVTKWTFDKNSEQDQAKLEELSKGRANLNLNSVQKKDSGTYTCNIKYRKLQKTLSTRLIVKDDDEEISIVPKIRAPSEEVEPSPPIDDQYRKEKIGLVVGAVAAMITLAFLIYFCVAV